MAATVSARTVERRRDWKQPETPLRKRGEVVVVDGFGVSVCVERGRLVVRDGAGRHRHERRYSRTDSQLARVITLGGSGTLTLEALHWLTSVGAALVCVDRDGRWLCTSAPTASDAKLRRAQALAPFNASGLEVALFLLSEKLKGQEQLLDRLPCTDGYAERVLERSLTAVDQAQTVADAVAAEAEAAAAYWSCWADVEVRFQPSDRTRVPEQWRTFSQRSSLLTSGPRMAANPAGAILNYLYALLEAETRLACLTVGLDPALAIVHADVRGRDSLPLDLMEAIRPNVDRYLLAFLRDRIFRSSEFHETQRGNCRLLAPLTHELAETLPAWRELVAPVVERVASLLMKTEPKVERPRTPLTQANRRADRARRFGRTAAPAQAKTPRPERRCKRCGGELPHRDRVYCDDCLPLYQREQYDTFAKAGVAGLARKREAGADPSHGGQAAQRRGATMADRRLELREWQSDEAAPVDPDQFVREILPLIQSVPLSQLMCATGLSLPYVSRIRRGEKVPHPRHWPALRSATGESALPGLLAPVASEAHGSPSVAQSSQEG